jgi:signal transduction histidine kinase
MPEILKFAGFAIGLACYSAVIFMPIMLLRNRFQRERMFLQLERSHHELEGAHQRLAQAAAHERELAVLRERGRLARDMHDTLGHSLALMTVKLEAAQRLRVVDPARADHEVAATQAIARGALAELRDAIADLRASDGSDGAESSDGSATARESLGIALTRAAEASAARAGWRLTCEMAPDAEPMCDLTYEALLRTGVEALTNSERHAQAHSVHLALSREGDMLRLRIEDDGVGILATNPPQRVRVGVADDSATAETITSPRGHYGITGMRERTTDAGGVFTIATGADGCGTRVEALLPAAST